MKKTVSHDEVVLIKGIVSRVWGILLDAEITYLFKGGRISLLWDVINVHEQCPLDLERMKDGAEIDVMHDVLGIYHNFDRRTKVLNNCFLPRFAKGE